MSIVVNILQIESSKTDDTTKKNEVAWSSSKLLRSRKITANLTTNPIYAYCTSCYS